MQHVGHTAEIDVYMSAKEDRIILDFVDNGPGIDEELIGNLFQKGVSKSGGGYGLYLSRKIIQIYGGHIDLLTDDTYSKGTTFRIELPRYKEEVKPRGHTGY